MLCLPEPKNVAVTISALVTFEVNVIILEYSESWSDTAFHCIPKLEMLANHDSSQTGSASIIFVSISGSLFAG